MPTWTVLHTIYEKGGSPLRQITQIHRRYRRISSWHCCKHPWKLSAQSPTPFPPFSPPSPDPLTSTPCIKPTPSPPTRPPSPLLQLHSQTGVPILSAERIHQHNWLHILRYSASAAKSSIPYSSWMMHLSFSTKHSATLPHTHSHTLFNHTLRRHTAHTRSCLDTRCIDASRWHYLLPFSPHLGLYICAL